MKRCARRPVWRPPSERGSSSSARTSRCPKAARRAGASTPATTYARQGDPAAALLDVAEERGADLIVVGNKGMTGADRFLLGSVPNKVTHHAPCSVLVIRV